ncbi:UNVERIFIED_ORG: chromosome segregation ATPase [Variovorax paradoxus]|nr:chromosome segregation ATPase [Variovorax paradoxus]
MANASQLGVLLLAVFGYFYTVLPVYQKSLLDEEIAKKTLELQAMEKRVAATEKVLSSREAELGVMNKRLAELRATAEAARAGLGRAQAEVGKLKDAVDTQYSELLPRLIRDFQSRSIQYCKASAITEQGFANCVEQRVIGGLALLPRDRERLLRIVRAASPALYASWTDHSLGIKRRKDVAEAKKRDAVEKCTQEKATEDYKDRFKKISIDHRCDIEMINASSDELRIVLDETYGSDKVVSPALAAMARDFFGGK